METRAVGESGVSISPVGLGGWELGPEEGEEPPVESARGALEAALAVGVNWVDTSEAYRGTRNEGLIGEAVRRLPDMQISSKVSPKPDGSGFRREEIKEACRASLQRLARKQIDLYFLHWPDESGVPIEDIWGAMSELVEAGLVRAIGLSNYDLEEVERCHAQRRVDVIQDGLSMIDYLDHRKLFTRCEELGIAAVIYEPLGGGVLAGKTLAQVQETWGPDYEEWPFYQRLFVPGKAEQTFAVVDGLKQVAEKLGASIAQVAIAWVLHQPGVTAAIAGSRNPAHARSNAEAAEISLTEETLGELEAIVQLGPTAS